MTCLLMSAGLHNMTSIWLTQQCELHRDIHAFSLSHLHSVAEPTHMKLSMRIRIARQRARMSQEALALNVGVTRSAVANWEGVEGVLPASARLARVAEITNVNFEWLATGRGPIDHAGNTEDTPAVESEIVYDELERRLLQAFRRMTPDARIQTILHSEAFTERARPTGNTLR